MKHLRTKILLTLALILILIGSSGTMVFADLEMFLLKDASGQYYTYNQNEINNSYLVYQLKPTQTGAKMYRHFEGVINSGGTVAGLKDSVKGYMDYAAASVASLKAQMMGTVFDINQYLASSSAKKLDATVSNVKAVDSSGNVAGSTLIYGDWLLISNESTNIDVPQSTGTLTAKEDGIEVMDIQGLDDEAFRVNPSLPTDPTTENLPIDASSQFDFTANALNDIQMFYAYNFQKAAYGDTVNARLAYSGTHVDVWVEHNNPKVVVTDAMAAQMGIEFEAAIYNLIRENYYTESDVNGDGKVAIICYDIQDNYGGPGTSYTGGYFASNDLTGTSYSNRMEVMYIDTWPTMGTDPKNPDVTESYSTLAHEFQHLVNANRNQLEEGRSMDTWLNEALSMSAEHLYEGVQTSRINYYNKSTAVRNGRSLLNWSNNEVLANYALSYLFSQYLSAQVEESLGTGHDKKIFKEIIIDSSGGYQAVENVVKKYIDGNLNFGKFATNFRGALLRKDPTGYYGFGGKTAFNSIETPLYSGGTTTLEGGGAVVKALTAPFVDPGNRGSNVTYSGLFKP